MSPGPVRITTLDHGCWHEASVYRDGSGPAVFCGGQDRAHAIELAREEWRRSLRIARKARKAAVAP